MGPIASVRKIARSTILTHRYRLLDPSSTFYENKSAWRYIHPPEDMFDLWPTWLHDILKETRPTVVPRCSPDVITVHSHPSRFGVSDPNLRHHEHHCAFWRLKSFCVIARRELLPHDSYQELPPQHGSNSTSFAATERRFRTRSSFFNLRNLFVDKNSQTVSIFSTSDLPNTRVLLITWRRRQGHLLHLICVPSSESLPGCSGCCQPGGPPGSPPYPSTGGEMTSWVSIWSWSMLSPKRRIGNFNLEFLFIVDTEDFRCTNTYDPDTAGTQGISNPLLFQWNKPSYFWVLLGTSPIGLPLFTANLSYRFASTIKIRSLQVLDVEDLQSLLVSAVVLHQLPGVLSSLKRKKMQEHLER